MRPRALPSSKATLFLVLAGLLALAVEIWQLSRTADLQDAILVKGRARSGGRTQPAARAHPPAGEPGVIDTPEEFADPGHPLTLADGTVISVKTTLPPNLVVHLHRGTVTLLADINGELKQLSFDDFIANPEFMTQMANLGRATAKLDYKDFLQQSNWPADRQNRLLEIMGGRDTRIRLLQMQFELNNNPSLENAAAFSQQVIDLDHATDTEARALFANDAEFSAFQKVRDEALGRGAVEYLDNNGHPPLTSDQSAAVIRLVQEVYTQAQLPELDVLLVAQRWGQGRMALS